MFQSYNDTGAQLGSQQSRGEFPNIMLEYGNEPLQYDIYTTIGKNCLGYCPF